MAARDSEGHATAEPSFYLGAVEPDPFAVHLGLPLSELEFEQIVAATNVCSTDTPFHFRQLERNYAQFVDVHRFVTIVLSIGREFASPDPRRLVEPVMSSVVNWLTSMSLFLDHEETDIKHRYGASSDEWDRFKTARSAVFDRRVGYRFAGKFRNYVLHCGLPLSRMQVGRPPAGSRAKQEVRLLVSRDQLLSSFEKWGAHVRRDLGGMEPMFELGPLIGDAMDGLREVRRFRADLDLDKSFAVHSILESAIARVRDAGIQGRPAVFRHVAHHRAATSVIAPNSAAMNVTAANGSAVELTPIVLPVEFVTAMSQVLAGEITRESLWAQPIQPFRPQLDPATIGAQLHQHERGVQVIAAWLHEGGHTPELHRIITQMVDEDDDVGPTLTGLIGISAVLAHVAAGALGTSATALMSGLADLYGAFDKPPSMTTDDR